MVMREGMLRGRDMMMIDDESERSEENDLKLDYQLSGLLSQARLALMAQLRFRVRRR